MRQVGDRREELRRHRLTRDEQLDGLDARGVGSLDEILALRQALAP